MIKDWSKLSELERLLYRELFKKDCYSFCCEFWDEIDPHPLKTGILTRFFCETFQYMSRFWVKYNNINIKLPKKKVNEEIIDVRENKHHLSISVPPRHGKSNFFNILCPTWLFINSPVGVASVSHTQSLAGTMNVKRQKLLNSEKFKFFFPEITLTTNSTYSLKDIRGGEMYSVPKNAITGFGCDLLIPDDLTNVSQAKRDAAEMENAWDIYTSTLPSRINDKNKYAIINIMQRIAPNDIVGRILNDAKLRKVYTFVTLPAIFNKNTYLVCPISGQIFKFKKGDPLFPEQFGDYSEIKATLTDNTWQSQYLQNPQNTDLSIIKENMIIEKDITECPSIENADMIYGSHDFPVSEKETSDFLGSVLAYRVNSTIYIKDCLEKHLGFVKSVNYVKQLDSIFPGIIQIIENKANGAPILQQLSDEIAGLQSFEPGTNSKSQRLESASMYINNIVFVKSVFNKLTQSYELSEALQNLKNRLLHFPFVQHDDVVDAFSMLILFVFMDKKYMVYGRAFNDQNIINIELLKDINYSTIFFNKEGDIWKILDIAIKYGINTELIVKRELRFKGSIEEGLKKLKEFAPKNSLFVDCSYSEALNGMYQNNITIEKYEIEDFEKSVAQTNLAFSKKLILLDKHCVLTKGDIENFKFSKTKNDNNIKFITEKDGFVSCIRTALRYYGGII